MLALWGFPTRSEDPAERIRPRTHLPRPGRNPGDVLSFGSEDPWDRNPCAIALLPRGALGRSAPFDAFIPPDPKA
jgi:hypothetical protein